MPITARSVELSRREMDRLALPDWARDGLVGAAEWTATLALNEGLVKMISTQVSLCGRTAGSLLEESDEPILFVPGSIVNGGVAQPGAVLTTRTGAIFAWTEGRFRLTYFGVAIPHSSVTGVETPPPPGGDYIASLRVVTVSRTLTVHFASVRNDNGPTGFLDAIVASLKGEGANTQT
jgi:hypothetical protein